MRSVAPVPVCAAVEIWVKFDGFAARVDELNTMLNIPKGLAVMGVGAAIGLIPILAGGRRMNCLGVILLPITLNVIGLGPTIAKFLGLL